MRSPRLLAVLLLAAATCAPVALAAPTGQLAYVGCSTSGASGCAVTGLPGFSELTDLVVTADGRNVYAVSFSKASIVRFDRNPSTGALTYGGCISGGMGCGAGADGKPGMNGAYRIAASADGRSVYVASQTDNAVVAFARDPGSGALTYAGCVTREATGCGTGNVGKPGLHTPQDVAVTPDGGMVFVASYDSNALTWLTRDPQTSALTFGSCLEQVAVATCGPITNEAVGTAGAVAVAVSPDSRHVYVAGNTSQAVARFTRDPVAGTVFYDGCYTAGSGCPNGANGVAPLTQAFGLALDPSGKSLYAVSQVTRHALSRFDLDAPTGALTFRDCFDAGQVCGGANDNLATLLFPSGIAISPDGRSLYVVATYNSDLVRFDRDPRDGSLARRDCFSQTTGCGTGRDGLPPLLAPNQDAVSPDGRDLYVATGGGRLLHFSRVPDTPPACTPRKTVSTEPSTSVRIKLSCGDANGDAFTVAFPGVPDHGALTRSADGGSVLYVPDHGYRGADRFSVQATDIYGVVGPAARVSLSVAPAVPKVTKLTLKPSRFRAAGSGASIAAKRKAKRPPIGTTVSYRIDHAAATTFTVTRSRPGIRKGRRCVAPPKKRAKGAKPKRCTRTQALGSFRRTSRAGANRFHFSGRVKGRALRPGTYTLAVTAKQPHGKRSKPYGKRFAIVR